MQIKNSVAVRRGQDVNAFHSTMSCGADTVLRRQWPRRTSCQKHSQILLDPTHDLQNHQCRHVDRLGTDDEWQENDHGKQLEEHPLSGQYTSRSISLEVVMTTEHVRGRKIIVKTNGHMLREKDSAAQMPPVKIQSYVFGEKVKSQVQMGTAQAFHITLSQQGTLQDRGFTIFSTHTDHCGGTKDTYTYTGILFLNFLAYFSALLAHFQHS